MIGFITTALIAGLAGAATVGGSASAMTAADVCGSGYSLVAKKDVSDSHHSTVRLLVNKSAKKFCAVNLSFGSRYGVKRHMNVKVAIYNKNTNSYVHQDGDAGNFQYYAGPTYVSYSGLNANKYHVQAYGESYDPSYQYYGSANIDMTVPSAL